MIDIVNESTTNSRVITGKIGGATGGIPVISQEINGQINPRANAKRHVSNMLPIVTGKNIGKKILPIPIR
jgi:hypothetical protein